MSTRTRKRSKRLLYPIRHTVPLAVIQKAYYKNFVPPLTSQLVENLFIKVFEEERLKMTRFWEAYALTISVGSEPNGTK